MSGSTPKTFKEAIALGHQELNATESAQVRAVYGAANKVAECGFSPPGTRCAETACVNGFKIVMYCDEANGCTRAVKVPC